MRSLLLAAVLTCVMTGDTLKAQEKDPFGESNPFQQRESETEQEERSGQPENREALKARVAQLQHQVAELRAHLEQARMAQREQEIKWIQRIRHAEEQHGVTLATFHQLYSKLLCSGDVNQQRTAMEHLLTIDEVSEGERRTVWLDQNAQQELERLLVSKDDRLQELAERVVVAFHPRALEIGYQKSGERWRPIPGESAGVNLMRLKLANLQTVDYDAVSLKDILAEFRSRGIHVVDNGTSFNPEDLVTYRCFCEPVSGSLSAMLGQHDLVYQVRHDHVVLFSRDDPDARVSQTYCVRGLLTHEVPVQTLDSMINHRFSDEGFGKVDVEIVDEDRLVVTATEYAQDQVSKYLAILARGK